MRWLVTGGSGMLATDVVDVLRRAGEDVTAVGRRDLDVADRAAVLARVVDVDLVVNCAAWTAVDAAESDEAGAFSANAVGAANLAEAARREGARLVHVSTDYVFDGRATSPYAEDDPTVPRTAYGRTKLAGEWAVRSGCPDHLVVRTGWLYGAAGRCFPRTIAGVVAERGAATVVDDQTGQPTWTRDVAELVLALVRAEAPSGVQHATSSGRTTWFDFARAVAASAGHDPDRVTPTATVPGERPAVRPAWSVLDHGALVGAGVQPIGDWRERWEVAAAGVLAGPATGSPSG